MNNPARLKQKLDQKWFEIYKRMNAIWVHDGNMKRPHALLTSGKHSGGFFNSEVVLEHPALVNEIAFDLIKLLLAEGLNIDGIQRVVGPAMGAITLVHDIARNIEMFRPNDLPCLRAYTIPEGKGADKKMVFQKTGIKAGEIVLAGEDVVTTCDSLALNIQAIIAAGGIVQDLLPVIVNRSGKKKLGDRTIVSLVERDMPTWDSEAECEYCRNGSRAIRPKELDNWALLNAECPA